MERECKRWEDDCASAQQELATLRTVTGTSSCSGSTLPAALADPAGAHAALQSEIDTLKQAVHVATHQRDIAQQQAAVEKATSVTLSTKLGALEAVMASMDSDLQNKAAEILHLREECEKLRGQAVGLSARLKREAAVEALLTHKECNDKEAELRAELAALSAQLREKSAEVMTEARFRAAAEKSLCDFREHAKAEAGNKDKHAAVIRGAIEV
jgi:chromosome segregation ATPase